MGTGITLGGLPVEWIVVWFALVAVMIIVAAIAVYKDARKQRRCALGMWPIWWAVLVLLTNIVGFTVYWALHHSTLRKEETERDNNGQ